MFQSDRGNYHKEETILGMFAHSCLGQFVIAAAILGVLALIALLTRPSEEYMRRQMTDNIRQLMQQSDSIHTDEVDDFVANIGFMFTSLDEDVDDRDKVKAFRKYNRLEYHDHVLYSTMHIFNNYHFYGERCALGIFGIVIPMISPTDLLLNVEPLRRQYNYKPNSLNLDDDSMYMGELPDMIFEELPEEEYVP